MLGLGNEGEGRERRITLIAAAETLIENIL
jgi:hypothetical protein